MQATGSWLRLLGQDCALCGARSDDALVCGACDADLRLAMSDARVTAAFEYVFPVDRMVQRFKYAGDLAVGKWLALRLARRLQEEARPDLIVATPLAPRRLRERGFNPALEVAKRIGRQLQCPVPLRAVERVRETVPQKGLSKAARKRNVRGAFRCRMDLHGLHVAIVDDVFTTGATAHAMRVALEKSGAAQISVWTLARTPAPGMR